MPSEQGQQQPELPVVLPGGGQQGFSRLAGGSPCQGFQSSQGKLLPLEHAPERFLQGLPGCLDRCGGGQGGMASREEVAKGGEIAVLLPRELQDLPEDPLLFAAHPGQKRLIAPDTLLFPLQGGEQFWADGGGRGRGTVSGAGGRRDPLPDGGFVDGLQMDHLTALYARRQKYCFSRLRAV